VTESKRVLIVTETGNLPAYYFERADVLTDLLVPSDKRKDDPNKGETLYWHVKVGDKLVENAAISYPKPPADAARIKDMITFVWKKADAL